MMNCPVERNLLFGILALQMDFISRDQLVAAMHAWVLDKSKPLEQLLLESNALRDDTHALLVALVAKHLELHEGDIEKSLGALSSMRSLGDELRSLEDPEIEATLPYVGADRQDEEVDPYATLPDVAPPTLPHVGASSVVGERFCILRPHAKGGLGVVSVARDEELNREVALKEIQQPFADDANSRSRFVLEAEITGGLEHPGIVPVYGLGEYDDGRPFYAMRFIRGDSLKEAIEHFHKEGVHANAEEQNLALRNLLGRFIDVCNAMEYAHSRGVLHRDLKPGNIMLGRYGETLIVDWGLAKAVDHSEVRQTSGEGAIHPRSGSGSTPTQMGSALGTPAYMSPEQAAGRLDELAPASDVYSLGATLYTLLTGKTAFELSDLGVLLQRVQTGEFQPPSQIKADVPKPLEAICLKAMALNASDRYATPRALADDMECYLADEPVSAYLEPLAMRAKRWRRKHPKIVASLAATVLVGVVSLASLLGVVSFKNDQLADANDELYASNVRESDARTEAENTAKRLAESNAHLVVATENAVARREEAEAVSDFLVSAFRSPDPEYDGPTLTLVELLAPSVAKLNEQFSGNPLIKARLLNAIGLTYSSLGLFREAIKVNEQALAIRQERLEENHPDTLVSMANLARTYQDHGDRYKALALKEKTLARTLATLGPEHPDTLMAMNSLALAHKWLGERKKALQLYQQTLKLSRTTLGPEHRDTLVYMSNLAGTLKTQGDFKQAISLYEETLKIRRVTLGREDPGALKSMNSLAMAYKASGDLDRAVALYEETLKIRRATRGPEHRSTLVSMNNLGSAYQARGDLEKAFLLFEATFKVRRKKLGPEHPDTLIAMQHLAVSYQSRGDVAKALPIYEAIYKVRLARLGPLHPKTLTTMGSVTMAYIDMLILKKDFPLMEESLRFRREKLGSEHPSTLIAMKILAQAYHDVKRFADAAPLLEEIVEHVRLQDPAGPQLANALALLACNHLRQNEFAAAELACRECLPIWQDKLPDHWLQFSTKSILGAALVGQKKYAAAEPLLLEGYKGMKQREDQIPRSSKFHLTEALERLVNLYEARAKP